MGDFIKDLVQTIAEALLEFLLHNVAQRIYRTRDSGRFGLMRATLLVGTVGGAIAGALGSLGLSPFDHLSPLLLFLWLPAVMVTMIGEYELGSRKLFWLVTAAAAAFLATAIFASI